MSSSPTSATSATSPTSRNVKAERAETFRLRLSFHPSLIFHVYIRCAALVPSLLLVTLVTSQTSKANQRSH